MIRFEVWVLVGNSLRRKVTGIVNLKPNVMLITNHDCWEHSKLPFLSWKEGDNKQYFWSHFPFKFLTNSLSLTIINYHEINFMIQINIHKIVWLFFVSNPKMITNLTILARCDLLFSYRNFKSHHGRISKFDDLSKCGKNGALSFWLQISFG